MTDDVTNDGLIVILATRIRIMNPTNTNILSWRSLMHAILIKATIQYMDSIVLVAQPFSFIFCVGRRRWGVTCGVIETKKNAPEQKSAPCMSHSSTNSKLAMVFTVPSRFSQNKTNSRDSTSPPNSRLINSYVNGRDACRDVCMEGDACRDLWKT